MKLKDVYAGNPALGDPTTLDKKIEENSQKLDGLRQELLKYEVVQGCYFLIFFVFNSKQKKYFMKIQDTSFEKL